MKVKLLLFVGVLSLIFAVGEISAQKKEIKRTESAARVFSEIMEAPDNRIPDFVLERANCVAVFPNMLKAAFVFGGRYGKGLVSCRNGSNWSAPVFMRLRGGSVGWQIGGQSTDLVLFFMTKDGINSLFDNTFTVGTELSVAAGPVGRTGAASTDVYLEAQILTYSRTKGVFAGLSLKGVQISPDKKAMKKVYGKNVKAESVIQKRDTEVSAAFQIYPGTLRRFSR